MEKTDEMSICENLPVVKSVDSNTKNVNLNVSKENTDSDHSTTKYDSKMADHDNDDKCINNQDICKNLKNVKNINKNDCNVVIDDDTQSKQQQDAEQPLSQQTYGCVHYKRKAKFVVSQKIIQWI